MNDESTFFTRPDGIHGTRFQFWAGGLGLAVGLLASIVIGLAGASALIGALMMFAAQWSRKNPLIRLNDDHMEMKLAIAAPRRLILYAQMIGLADPEQLGATLRMRDGAPIPLPMRALDEAARRRLIDELSRRIERAATTAA